MNTLIADEMAKQPLVDIFSLNNYLNLARTHIKYLSNDIKIMRSILAKDQLSDDFKKDLEELKRQRTECSKYIGIITNILKTKEQGNFDAKREFSILLDSAVVDVVKYNKLQKKKT